jgi:ankyrin repeat protein
MDARIAFIKAATWHGSLDDAEKMLAVHPELATIDLHTSAITGNYKAVFNFLAENPANANAVSEPYGCNALVYLCMSKYLQFDRDRSQNFLLAATALLDAGLDPGSGFWTQGNNPEFETALYGAAGVAHHPELTKLLLERGADPNDGEAVYHSPETHENGAMMALVETGKLHPESLVLMLIRKHDWHDYEGVKYLLEHGADPNTAWGKSRYPLHHALARSNDTSIIALLLEYGADPNLVSDGINAIARAAREGRGDVLRLFAEKGIAVKLEGVDQLIAACALTNKADLDSLLKHSPHLLKAFMDVGGELIARFSLSGNTAGVQELLNIGVDANTPYEQGDGYFGIPKQSLPIHIASWLGRSSVVRLLIAHGASIDTPDQHGNTPLALAILACINSYWTERRSPASVKALLDAGAKVKEIKYPSGYNEVDQLLESYFKSS